MSSPSAPDSSYRLTCLICRRLEEALVDQCAQHYDASVLLRWLDLDSRPNADDVTTVALRVDCRGTTHMPVRLTVRRTGRTLFDVCCAVEDGNSHRFAYSLPVHTLSGTSAGGAPSLPPIGEDLATFLRTELETRLGRLLLRSPARPPRGSFWSLS
jgi:hypothetical protein